MRSFPSRWILVLLVNATGFMTLFAWVVVRVASIGSPDLHRALLEFGGVPVLTGVPQLALLGCVQAPCPV